MHLDPFLYLVDDYIWYLRTVNNHHLGSCGYRTAFPKWQKLEQEILGRGIEPESMHWPKRAKYWFFGHGGTIDLRPKR